VYGPPENAYEKTSALANAGAINKIAAENARILFIEPPRCKVKNEARVTIQIIQ
jgi:hypothetical protein